MAASTPSPRAQHIVRAYRAGEPRPDIARRLHISKDAVRDALDQWGDWQPPLGQAYRRCLRCRGVFPSFGIGNRICGYCKSKGDP